MGAVSDMGRLEDDINKAIDKFKEEHRTENVRLRILNAAYLRLIEEADSAFLRCRDKMFYNGVEVIHVTALDRNFVVEEAE